MIHSNLTISNLMFSNCGAKSADGLHCGALILNTVFDLNLTNVIVENSTGYGLLGFNLLGKSSITNSVFRYNRATQDCIGGNAWIYYGNCPNCGTASSLIINSSQFLFGKVPITQSHSLGTGGLSFYIKCTNVSVNAANLTMYGNEGHYGGNLCIHFWLFTNISVTMENSYLGAGRGSRGGGVFVKIDPDVPVNDKYSCGDHSVLNQKSHQLVYFSNVTFDGNSAGNSGAGLEIEDFTPGYLCAVQLVMIDDSVFIYFPAHGMMEKLYSVMVYDTRTRRNIQTKFRNTVFKNHILDNNLYATVSLSVVGVESYVNVTFSNCTFMNNQATGIQALQTNVIFEGNNTFQSNSGVSGAGLSTVHEFVHVS